MVFSTVHTGTYLYLQALTDTPMIHDPRAIAQNRGRVMGDEVGGAFLKVDNVIWDARQRY